MDDQRKNHPDQKRPPKRTAPNTNRAIKCLPILKAQIMAEIYYLLINRGLFPKEQKGCPKGTRGTRDLLYIDNTSSRRVKQDGKM